MKKTIIFPFLLSMILISQITLSQKAQITLSFIGEDINTNEYVPLTSVYIKNLTVGCDTTLYGEVPSLVVELSSGIDEYSNNRAFSVLNIFPNPFRNHTTLELEVNKEENFSIELINLHGKMMAHYVGTLNDGIHYFHVTANTNGFCFLSISTTSGNKTIKIINLTNDNGTNYIRLIGKNGEAESLHKSNLIERGFTYNLGDQLMFKGVAEGYEDEISIDSPTENQIYTFSLTPEGGINLPIVITSPGTEITQTSATCGGNVTDDGGANVTARGVCWSTSSDPTITNDHTMDGTGTGEFISYLK